MIHPARINQQRERLRLSIEELAGRSGLTQQRLEEIEAGREQPSRSELEALARALDCRVAYLLNRSDTPTKPLTEADLSQEERALLAALRDPRRRLQLETAMRLDLQANQILDDLARVHWLHRLLKPMRRTLVIPVLLTPDLLGGILAIAYGIVLCAVSLVTLFALPRATTNLALVGTGLIMLSVLGAVGAARLTCWLILPVSLRGQMPKD